MAETEPTGSVAGPFHTPSWVRQRPGDHDQDPVLPAQCAPRHDYVPTAPTGPPIPQRANWGAHFSAGLPATLGLLFTGLMTIGGLVVAALVRTPVSLALPALMATVFLILRSQLTAGSGGRTTLERSLLEVSTRQGPRRFDLALPDIGVAMSESADDPKWQLILDDHQGKQVVLTRRHVPPDEVAPIVRHYRAIADARAKDRAFPLEN